MTETLQRKYQQQCQSITVITYNVVHKKGAFAHVTAEHESTVTGLTKSAMSKKT